MKRKGSFLKLLLFKTLSFEKYLYALSKFYFFSYKTGRLKNNPDYSYHYFLKNLINPGDTVVDIGANLGYYTCNFAKWVGAQGKVVSYEPVRPVMNVLKRNVAGRKNVTLKPYALGEETKRITLVNMTKTTTGYIASGSHFILEEKNVLDPDVETFDAEMKEASQELTSLGRIDFIKCDVEGYEVIILTNAIKILEQEKPLLLVESHGENRKKVLRMMTQLGYNGYILKDMKLLPYKELDDTHTDIVFIPTEKEGCIELYK